MPPKVLRPAKEGKVTAEIARLVAEIVSLKAQLKTAKEKGYEWREFAESAGDPYRPRCGHIVNRGWRCLVCGKDPSDD